MTGTSRSQLAESIAGPRYRVVSTDLFDTVLLRDPTTETVRLARSARRAAHRLGVDPGALTRLRWSCHDNAYRAVAIERPQGEASLTAICGVMAAAIGRGEQAARVLRDAEIETDCEHLRPNRRLLRLLEQVRASGRRVIAVSDTYYSAEDLRQILSVVVGDVPFAAVYSSADAGVTKHAGGLFEFVAQKEGVAPEQIVHVGDHPDTDVERAIAASWAAAHLPRGRLDRARRVAGRARSLPVRMERRR